MKKLMTLLLAILVISVQVLPAQASTVAVPEYAFCSAAANNSAGYSNDWVSGNTGTTITSIKVSWNVTSGDSGYIEYLDSNGQSLSTKTTLTMSPLIANNVVVTPPSGAASAKLILGTGTGGKPRWLWFNEVDFSDGTNDTFPDPPDVTNLSNPAGNAVGYVNTSTPSSTANGSAVLKYPLTGVYVGYSGIQSGDEVKITYTDGVGNLVSSTTQFLDTASGTISSSGSGTSGLISVPAGAFSNGAGGVELQIASGPGSGTRAAWISKLVTTSGTTTEPSPSTPTIYSSVPTTPSSLSDNGSGTITWSSSTNTDGYDVYSDGSYAASTTEPSYNYNSLPAGSHSITVAAANSAGDSPQSSPITVTSGGTGSSGGGTTTGGGTTGGGTSGSGGTTGTCSDTL